MKPKLKPCPFGCKGENARLSLSKSFIECDSCGAHGPIHFSPRVAVKLWNTRRTPRKAKVKR